MNKNPARLPAAMPRVVPGSGTGVKLRVTFPLVLSYVTDHSEAENPAEVKFVVAKVPLSWPFAALRMVYVCGPDARRPATVTPDPSASSSEPPPIAAVPVGRTRLLDAVLEYSVARYRPERVRPLLRVRFGVAVAVPAEIVVPAPMVTALARLPWPPSVPAVTVVGPV